MTLPNLRQTIVSRRAVVAKSGLLGIGAAAGVLAGTPRVLAAQDGTPVATSAANDPVIGDSVTLIGTDGAPIVEFTTDTYADPWQDYAPNEAPARGSRYVAFELTAQAMDRAAIRLATNQIVIQDSDGFLIESENIRNAENNLDGFFQNAEVEPGESIGGLLVYTLPSGITPVRLYYFDRSNRLLTLADLGA